MVSVGAAAGEMEGMISAVLVLGSRSLEHVKSAWYLAPCEP
jgi:hypothetical protein